MRKCGKVVELLILDLPLYVEDFQINIIAAFYFASSYMIYVDISKYLLDSCTLKTIDISASIPIYNLSCFSNLMILVYISICLSYYLIAVKRHQDQGNLQKKAFNWKLASWPGSEKAWDKTGLAEHSGQ